MVFNLSPLESQIIGKLVLATSLGALIGLERELKFSPAGIKTYSIVALGAALFTVLATLVLDNLAQGVVTGVGFLGAGAIFRAKTGVRGLTTAALIWISAAIGMTVGFGYYNLAIVTTVIIFIILVVIGYVERNYIEKLAEDGISLDQAKLLVASLAKRGVDIRKLIPRKGAKPSQKKK